MDSPESDYYDELHAFLMAGVRHRAAFLRVTNAWAEAYRREARERAGHNPEARSGERLERVLKALLTPEAFRMRVLVAVSEFREEYYEALAAGCIWHARWIYVRGQLLVARAFLCALPPQRVRRMF